MKSIIALYFYVFSIRNVYSSCVFESDFGFTLNCGIKKSGLFRVRNLGGVKGYVGVGFSVGDELGFRDSLSNVESNNRRSVDNPRLGGPAVGVLTLPGNNGSKFQSDVMLSKGEDGISSRSFNALKTYSNNMRRSVQEPVIPPFKPIVPLDVKVPDFHALPPSISQVQTNNKQPFRRYLILGPENNAVRNDLDSGKDLIQDETVKKPEELDVSKFLSGQYLESIAKASNISIDTLASAIKIRQQEIAQKIALHENEVARPILVTLPPITSTKSTTVTAEPVPEIDTKPTTIPQKPTIKGKKKNAESYQVMNAPKEYYPVSYEKDFDDNFVSKVDLPQTSFDCGDQKHFPGLYGDEDLGCMVFHVCALTDDGLLMKSFLCPESTLFDQTILKCNWWFYVDCKSSKKLYDSNIPMSKSYQLMKALTFFSSYSSKPNEK